MSECEIMVLKMSFHENLRRLRRDKGLNQHELGNLADIKTTHISRLEQESGDPKLSTIYKLMNALECSADALLADSGKLNLSGLLRASMERAENLSSDNKRTIVDIIDKYCIAEGLNKMMEKEQLLESTGRTKGMLE